MTARDEFEAGLSFFGIAVWGMSPRVTSEAARLHGAHPLGTRDGRAVRSVSLSARLNLATPRDRVVEARSRLV
jgi:hypothetical protein